MSFAFDLRDGFENFKDFLIALKEDFNNYKTIYKGRNEVKILNKNTINLVVKSFKKPNLFKNLLYFLGKKSKAKKSYQNAFKIADFTPKAIAYIEFYDNFFLKNSYFISEKFEYDFTIREVLTNDKFKNKDEILKNFTKFSFDLHEKGILHLDYSAGNILVKDENENYIFKVVDINRMKFKELNLNERLKNFSMLWLDDKDAKFIAKEYAKLYDKDEDICTKTMLNFSHNLKKRKNFKKRLKAILKGEKCR
ncbi:hypothetical protein F1B92_05050 [Campylobacter sp. FMV-PI01]|uniref:Protein kinase domain-containing protein n=1 Tax=Campylobacter portucalensis TaxID=2608384 RepID=A0A6L5WHH6_9BACT|nr:lipopolysaccharide kinase InaA family protein [Campylobacter portucalensis]MSN96539.1 hypothetical protein [Campylobacter portucalensis]